MMMMMVMRSMIDELLDLIAIIRSGQLERVVQLVIFVLFVEPLLATLLLLLDGYGDVALLAVPRQVLVDVVDYLLACRAHFAQHCLRHVAAVAFVVIVHVIAAYAVLIFAVAA